MQFLSLIWPLILTFLGLLLLAFSVRMFYTEHVMKKRGKKYPGKVVDEVKGGIDDGYAYRTIYDPVIEYQNDKNETKRVRSSLGTGSRWKTGDVIDVYDFKDQVFIDHRLEHWMLKCGLIFFGFLLIGTGLYFIFH